MDHYRRRLKRFGMPIRENVSFFDNVIVQVAAIGVGLLAIISLGLLLFSLSPDLATVRLQYSVYFGTALRAQWWSPYILVIVGFLFFLLNMLLAHSLYNARLRIAAYGLLLSALFAHIALLVAVISIVLNN